MHAFLMGTSAAIVADWLYALGTSDCRIEYKWTKDSFVESSNAELSGRITPSGFRTLASVTCGI